MADKNSEDLVRPARKSNEWRSMPVPNGQRPTGATVPVPPKLAGNPAKPEMDHGEVFWSWASPQRH